MKAPSAPHTYDTIVIGGGVAGLFAALSAATSGRVLVLAKDNLSESNSTRAQGGIAVALREGDEPRLHALDTLAAGAGFAHPEAVRLLTEEAPARITHLMRLGVPFDRLPAGKGLAWGREGAHGLPRILHAGGDATGARMIDALVERAQKHPHIELVEERTAVSLLVEDGVAQGVYHVPSRRGDEWDPAEPAPANAAAGGAELVRGRFLVLATGGAGQLFARTTNPLVATGDGLALAYDCGAALCDLEMFQFHPTVLALPGAPAFLLSEAMRGEGGVLRNAAGERFAAKYHPDGELAPRDVVTRAILAELAARGDRTVFLDMTHLPADDVRGRFPTIDRECRKLGLDVTSERIPVTPAAHYFMGGVWTNDWGQTTVPGLFACGEVACTGVHGANRLASNSLLEAIVFGGRAAQAIGTLPAWPSRGRWMSGDPSRTFTVEKGAPLPLVLSGPRPDRIRPLDRETVQDAAWRHLGPVRSKDGLLAALRAFGDNSAVLGPHDSPRAHDSDGDSPGVPGSAAPRAARTRQRAKSHGAGATQRTGPHLVAGRDKAERRSLTLLGQLAARAALTREESRGAHYRTDYPEPRPEWRRHIIVRAARSEGDCDDDIRLYDQDIDFD